MLNENQDISWLVMPIGNHSWSVICDNSTKKYEYFRYYGPSWAKFVKRMDEASKSFRDLRKSFGDVSVIDIRCD